MLVGRGGERARLEEASLEPPLGAVKLPGPDVIRGGAGKVAEPFSLRAEEQRSWRDVDACAVTPGPSDDTVRSPIHLSAASRLLLADR